jgi:tRNA threonylcarbamoyl adenosine modification protein (Sua5/YciO/YrdC/YwlC family)
MNPKRRTSGIRVPAHPVCQALLRALGNPIISTSAHLADENGKTPVIDLERARLFDEFDTLVDIIVDDGNKPGFQVSTIVDMTDEEPVIVRKGLGWEAATSWASLVS